MMNYANDNSPTEELNVIADRFMIIGTRFLEQGRYEDALDAFLMSNEIYLKLGILKG